MCKRKGLKNHNGSPYSSKTSLLLNFVYMCMCVCARCKLCTSCASGTSIGMKRESKKESRPFVIVMLHLVVVPSTRTDWNRNSLLLWVYWESQLVYGVFPYDQHELP